MTSAHRDLATRIKRALDADGLDIERSVVERWVETVTFEPEPFDPADYLECVEVEYKWSSGLQAVWFSIREPADCASYVPDIHSLNVEQELAILMRAASDWLALNDEAPEIRSIWDIVVCTDGAWSLVTVYYSAISEVDVETDF